MGIVRLESCPLNSRLVANAKKKFTELLTNGLVWNVHCALGLQE